MAETETSLDNHFAVQLRMMISIFNGSIPKPDVEMSKLWLDVFHNAPKGDKYARNCLMLLMFEQLKYNGKLGKPFTDLENLGRSLEYLLSEDLMTQNDPTEQLSIKSNRSQVSIVGDGSRYRSLASGLDTAKFEEHKRKNEELLQDLNVMQALSEETEQFCKQTNLNIERKVKESTRFSQECVNPARRVVDRVEGGTLKAIKRLKHWPTVPGPLNFMATALADVVDDSPETKQRVLELDNKLERMLENVMDEACKQREKNLRVLYDNLLDLHITSSAGSASNIDKELGSGSSTSSTLRTCTSCSKCQREGQDLKSATLPSLPQHFKPVESCRFCRGQSLDQFKRKPKDDDFHGKR